MQKATEFRAFPIAVADAFTRHDPGCALYLAAQGGNNHVLYRDHAEQVSERHLATLGESGVSNVYVRADDLVRFEQSLEANLTRILTDERIDPAHKAVCVQEVGMNLARNLMSAPGMPRDTARAGRVLDQVIEHLLRDQPVAEHLLRICGHHQTTASHSFAVAALSILLGAEVLGDQPAALRELGLAGMLHDVGKVSIPSEILNKRTALTPEEIKLLHHHPTESVRLLGDDAVISAAVRQMVLQHHERMDGRGYPLGLSGAELLPGAKIITIADSYHALIGRRAYRNGKHPLEANALLRNAAGSQFDEKVFAAWESLFARCWPAGGPELGSESTAMDEGRSYHADHAAAMTNQFTRRWPRRPCGGRTQVRCVHAAQLNSGTSMSAVFDGPIQDVSKAGLCMWAGRPLYRGEVLHVRMSEGDATTWMRGVVMWCRRMAGAPDFRAGVEFVGRLDDRDVGKAECVRMMQA